MTNFPPSRRSRWWPGPMLVIAGSLLAAVAIWIAAGRARPPEPLLRVDRDSVDLGDVPLGQWAEASFTLTNAGTETLRLTEAPYVEIVAGC